MKWPILPLWLGLYLFMSTTTQGAVELKPIVIKLWPGIAPGEDGSIKEEIAQRKGANSTITSITNVTIPTLTLYKADKSNDTGVAIVICPGGGYNNLAWDHEGEQVARWLHKIGVTGIILKYRVPRRASHPNQPPPQALMDAQRALSLVRSKAESWRIDPKRIGILGFSAGGHLAAWASTNFDKRAYDSIDDIDKQGCRPDFAVLIYSGGVLKRGTTEVSPEIRISENTPPTFFVHANDDRPESSIYLFLAMKQAKVPVEMHIYNSGGHGFGMRQSGKPTATWPARCEEWLRDREILNASNK
jgi:acetyl esterase/lipase